MSVTLTIKGIYRQVLVVMLMLNRSNFYTPVFADNFWVFLTFDR